MKIDAIVIPVEGDVEKVSFDRKDELNVLQEAVGGWIEAVDTGANGTMWVNEEGKLMNLPINKRATYLWWTLVPAARGRDMLCGDVVVTGGIDHTGNTTSTSKLVTDLLFGVE